mmetsp:Transcript_99959/g.149784  ORF Transcript_99959/g.149784 Transcript_99959/m.149784 type:complete len:94 (+) Transcript_99959:226-507(+)
MRETAIQQCISRQIVAGCTFPCTEHLICYHNKISDLLQSNKTTLFTRTIVMKGKGKAGEQTDGGHPKEAKRNSIPKPLAQTTMQTPAPQEWIL